MSDPLDLIAEARSRQEAAERERDHWKKRAEAARRRLKLVIEMAKRYPIEPPPTDEEGMAEWKSTMRVVDQFVDVISDPYAAFDEEDIGMSHETARHMMCWRIQDMVKAAKTNAPDAP